MCADGTLYTSLCYAAVKAKKEAELLQEGVNQGHRSETGKLPPPSTKIPVPKITPIAGFLGGLHSVGVQTATFFK